MATEEDYVGLLAIIAEIREASGLGAKPMLTELPAAISRLVGERDESNANVAKLLTAAREDFELMKDTASTVQSLTARATAAEARVAQLETALKACIHPLDADEIGTEDWWREAHNCVAIARTALSQSPDRESGT